MEIFLIIFATIFGLLVGSFLNALIYRLPRNINIAVPRSSCTSCNKVISWYENIPVLSYIFLRGKCSGCDSKISWEYPFVEIISALAAFLIAPSSLSAPALLNFFFFFSVYSCFLVHFIVDLKHQILPDSINLYLAALFLLVSWFSHPWTFWLIGGALGLGFPLLVSWVFYLLRGEVGLGGGDIKLYGALGFYLGPIGIMQNIFLSCFLGALVGIVLIATKVIKKENPIPFGPFIIVVGAFQVFGESWFKHLMSYIP
ncbi:prepilin peptidase [Bacteriovorax sp. PP10]|uniref:Prepilin leader peptidase/N-methyltransferase n=1 Tax=Bacteriovorax antarcticus TaxID=3088717 RepID=A0ABU5VPY3_9BACT|nr:prepilin peptidase [Bacteriovorax sp. PP10]MEA9354662.1 prepilin peptidase [Bacteriovorax sp. PP10]